MNGSRPGIHGAANWALFIVCLCQGQGLGNGAGGTEASEMDSHPLPGAGPPLPLRANAVRSRCRGEAGLRPAQASGLCPAFLRPPRLLGTEPPCVVTLVSSALSVSQAFILWAVLETPSDCGTETPGPRALADRLQPFSHPHRTWVPRTPLRPDLPRRRPLLPPPLTTGPRDFPGSPDPP